LNSATSLHLPIGIFDSGIGGLTVGRAIRQALPHESLLYLGDTARVPYGSKSASTVRRYALQIADFLQARGIKYLVVACHTASAHALEALQTHVRVPVVGMVAGGAHVAAGLTRTGHIGVLGTLGTIASGAHARATLAHNDALNVLGQACPLFVPLAEEGWFDHVVTQQVARHYLSQLCEQSKAIDVLVLGCTHYPLLRQTIEQQAREVFCRDVMLVDPAQIVAETVRGELRDKALAFEHVSAEHIFLLTDESRFDILGPLFWGSAIGALERVNVDFRDSAAVAT